MPTCLLDTNTCIAAIRQEPPVLSRMLARSPDEMSVASMTVAELWIDGLVVEDWSVA